MEHPKEHPDHERARNAGRVSPDHGDTEDVPGRRHGPTPGHPTVILDASDITSAQIGPGGLGDLVAPVDGEPEEDPKAKPPKRTDAGKH